MGIESEKVCKQVNNQVVLDILKIKRFKNFNKDHKKANKQDIRYYSIDSNRQDNIQLSL